MKTIFICLLAAVLGIGVGTGAGFLSYSDPGPDFEWMHKKLLYEGSDAESIALPAVESIDVVGGAEFDFGIMDRGETRSKTFILKNNTSKPLFPVVTGTTCKCTVGELEDSRIGPGEEGNVTLEWEARSLDTEFRQSATIATGNDVRSDIVLSVYGRVIQMVDVKPRSIAFNDVSIRDERSGEFFICAFKDERLTILEENWSNPETQEFFEFEWEMAPDELVRKTPDATSGVIGKITMKPGLPLGTVYQALELKTSSSKAGMIDVPVSANIVGDITLSGSRYNSRSKLVRMGPVHPAKGMETKVSMMIKGKYASDFEVSDVSVEPQDVLRIDLEEIRTFRDGKIVMIPIRVSVPAGAPLVNYSGGKEHPMGKVTLTTNHPDAAEISFDVAFTVVE